MSIKVRFAPSPTGLLHVGGARTALFNYLFAKKHKGQFVLRLEDTDQERHQEESVISILKSLKWLGLDWDEGLFLSSKDKIIYKGPQKFYRQSERLDIYRRQAEELIQKEKAYYCFLSEEEETQMRNKIISKGETYFPSSPYRNQSLKESQRKMANGEKACIRFKTNQTNKNYIINDLVRGKVTFASETVGDFVIIRSDGYPVYSFSCAIDDALMKITHVFRGEEHLPNTLKQILIHESLNFPTPQTGHLSIILGKDKKKLSKRSGSQSVKHFKDEGFLPSSLINFLSLLGWNPGTEQEFFTKKELIKTFSTEGLNLSAAVFDEDKLLWLNKEHLKKLSHKELWKNILPFLKKEKITIDKSWKEINKILESTRSSFKTFKQSVSILKNFSDNAEDRFVISSEVKKILNQPKSKQVIQKWKFALEGFSKEYLSLEDFKSIQKSIQTEENVKGKDFFMPLRCALIGEPEGIEIKILITLLDRKELIERSDKILKSF